MIERVGEGGSPGRTLYLATVERIDDWPDEIAEPRAHFVLFLALDATDVPDVTVSAFASRILDQGAAYVCAWGPGCERVHDLFDVARGPADDDEEELVTTTWHADDTLDEALWFALYAACPEDPLIETCTSVLAVVVGREDWAEEVRRRLADPDGLSADVVFR